MISTVGLDKAAVLMALYNHAAPRGLGYLYARESDLTIEECQEIMGLRGLTYRTLDFDYLNGRRLKVNLTGDEFNPDWYDREYGEGAARRIIDQLRS